MRITLAPLVVRATERSVQLVFDLDIQNAVPTHLNVVAIEALRVNGTPDERFAEAQLVCEVNPAAGQESKACTLGEALTVPPEGIRSVEFEITYGPQYSHRHDQFGRITFVARPADDPPAGGVPPDSAGPIKPPTGEPPPDPIANGSVPPGWGWPPVEPSPSP